MTDDESADYALWVKLANDPSQAEQARQQYRELMQAYMQKKLREAFRLTSQAVAASAPDA